MFVVEVVVRSYSYSSEFFLCSTLMGKGINGHPPLQEIQEREKEREKEHGALLNLLVQIQDRIRFDETLVVAGRRFWIDETNGRSSRWRLSSHIPFLILHRLMYPYLPYVCFQPCALRAHEESVWWCVLCRTDSIRFTRKKWARSLLVEADTWSTYPELSSALDKTDRRHVFNGFHWPVAKYFLETLSFWLSS